SSNVNARDTNSSSATVNALISETFGLPSVNVPVLSNAIDLIAPALSRDVPPFISTPFLAAFPIAETIATGVEITSAQGQATTNKASPLYVHVLHAPKPKSGGRTITAIANAKTIGV